MANTKYGIYKDMDKYKDVDAEEILKTLTEEELEQLAEELDPDVIKSGRIVKKIIKKSICLKKTSANQKVKKTSGTTNGPKTTTAELTKKNESLPASDRQKEQTKKQPTGPFDRQHLIEFLEKKAKEEKDWDDKVPYKAGEKRGKIYAAKTPETATNLDLNIKLDADWEHALEEASEEDLVDLAGILGLHGMLNQEQFEAAQRNEKLLDDQGGFQGIAKFSLPKSAPEDQKNDTDVAASIKLLQSNDASLKTLNLNNILNMSLEQLKNICGAVEVNTQLRELFMANTRLNDQVAKVLGEALKKSKTLTSLNVESNFITQVGVNAIMQAMRNNTTLTELRIANQNCQMGQKLEREIADILEANTTLLKFGFAFEHAGPRVQAHDAILRNIETVRKGRVNSSK